MKKVFIFAIALLVAGVANAQTSTSKSGGGPQFGLKAGGNFSNIIKTGDESFKTEFKPGFNAGLFVEIPVVDRLSFAPELMYSQKGYKADRFGGTLTQTTNWVEIPILAKIQASSAFNIFLGPQVSFLTKTTNNYDGAFITAEQTIIEEDSQEFKKSIAGGVVGVGIDITPKVGISARYALDFQKNDKARSTPEFKNQVIQASLGFKF